jgi:hypothetical protein
VAKIQVDRKGSHMNNVERYGIFCAHKQNKQMEEVLFDLNSPIFETIYITITLHNKNHPNYHTADSSTIPPHPKQGKYSH